MRRGAFTRYAGIAVFTGTLFFAGGCVHDTAPRYRVVTLGQSDSLWRVARAHGVSLGDLVRANPGLQPSLLRPGSRIYLPPGRGFRMPSSFGWRSGGDAFIWPVTGRINSVFGRRGRRRHDGLDLKAPRGSPVHAAEGGRVIASDRTRGYGNFIKIRHSASFVTLYAHNNVNLVVLGARVVRGQVIARVGQTGNATGPHLHFEIIRDARARDPLYYLPIGRRSGAFAGL